MCKIYFYKRVYNKEYKANMIIIHSNINNSEKNV